jgi:hypothetical protein
VQSTNSTRTTAATSARRTKGKPGHRADKPAARLTLFRCAWKFEHALDATLRTLARLPAVGRRRNFRSPELHDLRSFRVERPFGKHMIFYRVEGDSLGRPEIDARGAGFAAPARRVIVSEDV